MNAHDTQALDTQALDTQVLDIQADEYITMETTSDHVSCVTGEPKRLFMVTSQSLRERTSGSLGGMPSDYLTNRRYIPLNG